MSDSSDVSESEEFWKKEVEALLKERPKTNKKNKGSDEISESGNDEFSKEEVEALLKEEPEAMEITNQNERLKLCIKWFQQVDENHKLDKVKLQSDLEAMHRKWFDAEMDMLDIADHMSKKKTKLRKRYTTFKKKMRAKVADLKSSLAEQRDAADVKERYKIIRNKMRAEVADLKASLAEQREQREAADMKVKTLEAKLAKYEET